MKTTTNRQRYEQCRRLLRRGFDKSRTTPDGILVKCSRCEPIVSNGTATHERGCPNKTT